MAPQAGEERVIEDREFNALLCQIARAMGTERFSDSGRIAHISVGRSRSDMAIFVVAFDKKTDPDKMGSGLSAVHEICDEVKKSFGLHFCFVQNRSSTSIRAFFARDRTLFTVENMQVKHEDDIVVPCACD